MNDEETGRSDQSNHFRIECIIDLDDAEMHFGSMRDVWEQKGNFTVDRPRSVIFEIDPLTRSVVNGHRDPG